jgi:CRISPR-associated protein Csm5
MKRFEMKLQILSPVHIGTGYQIPPYEYIVKGEDSHRIDLFGLLSTLSPDEKDAFYKAVNNTNPAFIRKFIAEKVDLKKHSLYRCTASEYLEKQYKAKFDDPNNQLLVDEFPRRTCDKKPYIPGSSIKGAIRMAIISEMAENTRLVKNEKYFEKDLIGYNDAKQDPFRCLKISDAPLENANNVFVDEVKSFNPKKDTQASSIQIFCEQLYSLLDSENVFAVGELAVDELLPKKTYFDKRKTLTAKAVTREITCEQIAGACRKFYLDNMKWELEKFYKGSEKYRYCEPLLDIKYADNEFPLRLGRFNHCEAVTVPNLRRPKTRKGPDGNYLPWGTTRTTSNDVPMGWVKVTLKEKK